MSNMRQMRRIKGLTQAELAAKLTIASGEEVTPLTISRWERGERVIPAYMLGYAAVVMGVSVQAFFDMHTTMSDKRLLIEYAALPEREKEILRYIASGWNGDTHALAHWVAMYTSVQRSERADIAGLAIHQYKEVMKRDKIDKGAPAPDMEYLERAHTALMHKTKGGD